MKFFLFVISLFCSLNAAAQIGKKIGVKNSFLSFENTRLSAGVNLDYGYAALRPKPTDFTGGNKINIGLLFHLYSPLSTTGFVTGVGYNVQEHKLGERENNVLTGDSIFITAVEIPFYLKFRIGPVSSKYKFILMPGVAYNIVQNAKIESDFFSTIEDKNLAKNNWSYKLQLGCEIAIGRQSRKEFNGQYVSDARTRLMVYLGANYAKAPIYDEGFNGLPDFSISDFTELGTRSSLNVYAGVTAYLTLGTWGDMGKSVLNSIK